MTQSEQVLDVFLDVLAEKVAEKLAQQMSRKAYYTVEDLCKRYQASPSTIRSWIREGRFGPTLVASANMHHVPAEGVRQFEADRMQDERPRKSAAARRGRKTRTMADPGPI